MPELPAPCCSSSQRLYITLASKDVARFKFLLEGYDNLAIMSILDKYACVAQLRFGPGQYEAVTTFLENIAPEIPFRTIDYNTISHEPSERVE